MDRSTPAAVNASSVGANTVKGPVPSRVVTKSAVLNAATSAVWIPVLDATLGISTKSAGGIKTVSMTCITPFDAITSALTTFASLTITTSAFTVNDRLSPFKAGATIPSVRSVDRTESETTWYVRMSASAAISSSELKFERSTPAALNASSVGAKTVNGPAPSSVATKLALASAATRDVWIPVELAIVGISSRAGVALGSRLNWDTMLL